MEYKPNIEITDRGFAVKFESWVYPGGEVGVRVPLDPSTPHYINIKARLRSANDILALLLLVDALKRADASLVLNELKIPYFPYARQDRVAIGGDPHSVKVMANLIDELGFRKIEATDPHSPAIENCFNKTYFSIAKHSTSRLKSVIVDIVSATLRNDLVKIGFDEISEGAITLIIPDEGASKRVKHWAGLVKMSTASFVKQRDPETGKLAGFKLVDGNVEGKKCIIVDDICDGGGTFLGIARILKEQEAEEVYLYVTHGIFSAGYDALLSAFDGIYCTDSYQSAELYDPRIKVIKL